MGLLRDSDHPLFKDYPTDFHSDYQWFIQSSQRALILPDGIKSIVTVLDSYAYLRNMGMLLEFNCEKGRVLMLTGTFACFGFLGLMVALTGGRIGYLLHEL